jgi:serine/threonine protein kinase/tetratricopeptide (TPR) repeat protein
MRTEEINIPGYQIRRTLGVGGMATVYLAIQQSLGREVALKVMSPRLADDPSYQERFVHEARIAAKLDHPNIAQVYDVGTAGKHSYISMQYHEGVTLNRHSLEGMKAGETVRIVGCVADALAYAHDHHVIHRDIKLENILLRRDGRVVLTDFGIAKATDADASMTQTGSVLGTPYYISPEQARGQQVDARTDLYSLGVVFYAMLTGEVPYDAPDSISLCLAHINDPIPRMPEPLAAFDALMVRMLAKDQEDRFQDCKAFRAALERLKFDPDTYWRRETTDAGADPVESPENARLTTPLVSSTELSGDTVGLGHESSNDPTQISQQAMGFDDLRVPDESVRERPSAPAGGRSVPLWLGLSGGALVAVVALWVLWPGDDNNVVPAVDVPADAATAAAGAEVSRSNPQQIDGQAQPQDNSQTVSTADAAPAGDPADEAPYRLDISAMQRWSDDALLEELQAIAMVDPARRGVAVVKGELLTELAKRLDREAKQEIFELASRSQTLFEQQEALTAALAERPELRAAVAQHWQAQRINQLLSRARAFIAADRLTSPAEGNALDTLQQGLDTAPDNARLRAAMSDLVTRYRELASAASQDEAFDAARTHLQRGLQVARQYAFLDQQSEQLLADLQALETRQQASIVAKPEPETESAASIEPEASAATIDTEPSTTTLPSDPLSELESQSVAELLRNGERLLEDGDSRRAYGYFQAVLRQEPDNRQAARRLRLGSGSLIRQADRALQREQFDDARGFLREAAALDSGHPDYLAVSTRLERAMARQALQREEGGSDAVLAMRQRILLDRAEGSLAMARNQRDPGALREALVHYQEAQALLPSADEAVAGIAEVATLAERWGSEALSGGRLQRAQAWLTIGRDATPDEARWQALQLAIDGEDAG